MSAAWAEAGYGIAKEYVMHWVSGAVLDSDDSRSGLSDTHLKSSPWELKGVLQTNDSCSIGETKISLTGTQTILYSGL